MYDEILHAPLKKRFEVQKNAFVRKYDSTLGSSFREGGKNGNFEHGNDDDRHKCTAMGEGDLKVAGWVLHHCLLPLL